MNMRTIGVGIVAVALILAISMTASAEPEAATPVSDNATGGDITGLDLNATTQTYNWAGYYGEVSGTLRLADGSNNVMYSWASADSGGEVYASTGSSITWSSIAYETVSNVDGALAYLDGKSDSATNTFADDSNSAAIDVGTVLIGANTTAATHTYVDGVAQSTDFEEVILHDGTNIVWTAIVSPNEDGFETGDVEHDYQMIVPEDGSGNTNATTYYFYVELT